MTCDADDCCQVRILDVVSEAEETLEFKDRVVAMDLSDTHLIICSPNQCYIYSLNALNTPVIVDIKEPPVHIQQVVPWWWW